MNKSGRSHAGDETPCCGGTRPLHGHAKRLIAALSTLGLTAGTALPAAEPPALTRPVYAVEGEAIVRHNGPSYNNRPLFGGAEPLFFVLAGDRPFLRLLQEPYDYGTFMVAMIRDGQGKWLAECTNVTAKYRPDRMEWLVRDNAFSGTVVNLQAVPMTGVAGMAMRVNVQGARAGDQLVWACGPGRYTKTVAGAWNPNGANAKMSFVPENCRGADVRVTKDGFTIRPAAGEKKPMTILGRCSAPCAPVVAEASAWRNPVDLLRTAAQDCPAACGTVAVQDGEPVFWTVALASNAPPQGSDRPQDPAQAFAAGWQRAETIGRRVVVETPDPQLNAGVAASCAAIDALWSPPMYQHGVMAWRNPYMGWRTLFGATAYGWHDRVQTQIRFLAAAQIRDSTNVTARADPKNGLAWQGYDSCFHLGRGKIRSSNEAYQSCYEMQSQFFDQAVQEWRYTADGELEKVLRPALELHLDWIRMCFDPDDDGTYESYMNTWPTDNQWYSGGGTAEETAYAYRGHLAARDMARRARDKAAVRTHEQRLAKIRRGFFERLWVGGRGHPGAYREQGGLERLHEDCWLYSIFLPIDAGLLDFEQAASSLHFTEYGLERFPMRLGGQRVMTSNWVPAIRTVRCMHSGDNYHLALAYFQTGLADDGWNVLLGTYVDAMYDHMIPGDVAGAWGIDFADSAQMFCRAVVEGVFGYTPDYPRGIVTLAPQFPSAWDRAAIRTPDMSASFTRSPTTLTYAVTLTRPAMLDVRLPVQARSVSAVRVNGRAAPWKLLPGFGTAVLHVRVPECRTAEVVAVCGEWLPSYPAVQVEAVSGQPLALEAKDGRILEFKDSQGALTRPRIRGGVLTGRVSTNAGDHLVLALADTGSARQWRSFKLHIVDPEAEARRLAKRVDAIPTNAAWACLDLGALLNGDIRTIYQQEYLSPRPPTCSLRIAIDGYRSWMMQGPTAGPPPIDLGKVPALLQSPDRLLAPPGVPFRWPGESRNIIFTSRWDNWPKTAVVPVGKKGEALWFLICGSTQPMQTRIANAELRMTYADGVVETLELVPPMNYWNLCPIFDREAPFDYDYGTVGFSLPKVRPQTVQLGNNCRAMVLNWRLRPGVELESVTLATLSQEVVVGLMGVTLMNPGAAFDRPAH